MEVGACIVRKELSGAEGGDELETQEVKITELYSIRAWNSERIKQNEFKWVLSWAVKWPFRWQREKEKTEPRDLGTCLELVLHTHSPTVAPPLDGSWLLRDTSTLWPHRYFLWGRKTALQVQSLPKREASVWHREPFVSRVQIQRPQLKPLGDSAGLTQARGLKPSSKGHPWCPTELEYRWWLPLREMSLHKSYGKSRNRIDLNSKIDTVKR